MTQSSVNKAFSIRARCFIYLIKGEHMIITFFGLILFDLSEWIKHNIMINETCDSSMVVTVIGHKIDYG